MKYTQEHRRWLAPRQYAKTAAMSATSVVGDSLLFMLDYLLRVLRVLVLLSIWRTLFEGSESIGGLTLAALLTYSLVAEAFAELFNVNTGMDTMIWEGMLATRYLRPMSMFGQLAAETAGRWLFGLAVFSLPLFVLAPVLGVDPRPASLVHGLAFIPSLALAVSVGLALDFIFAVVMVRLESSIWIVNQLRAAVTLLFGGALIPLSLLPYELGAIFEWLPFAAMASAPLRIYTGTGDPVPLLLLQAGWSVVLWAVTHWAWNANRQRLVSYGG